MHIKAVGKKSKGATAALGETSAGGWRSKQFCELLTLDQRSSQESKIRTRFMNSLEWRMT